MSTSILASRNARLFVAYTFLREPLFWGPYVIESIIRLGSMSLAEFFFMEALLVVFSLCISIPTGAYADVVGRKRMAVFGSIVSTIGFCFFAIMSSPLEVWIGNILLFVGYTATGTALPALVYGGLLQSDRSRFDLLMGIAHGFRYLGFAVSALVAGALVGSSGEGLRLVLIYSIPGLLISCVVICLFVEVRTETKELPSLRTHLEHMHRGICIVIHTASIQWTLAFAALVFAVSQAWFFTYNPYFELVGMPASEYGMVFAALNIVAALCSFSVYAVRKRIGMKGLGVSMILALGIAPVLMGVILHPLMAYAVVAQNIARGFIEPMVQHLLNRSAPIDTLATIGGARMVVLKSVHAVGLIAVGLSVTHIGLPLALVVLGMITLLLGSLLLIIMPQALRQ